MPDSRYRSAPQIPCLRRIEMNAATPSRLPFASDYMHGAHPDVLEALCRTNMEAASGYGTDEYSENARSLIREACGAPDAEVFFLAGGTQANAVCIGALLDSYEGVIAADTGHVCLHEAGAIELTGHKVLQLPQTDGKLSAETVDEYCGAFFSDDNRDHMVMPGMVYISHPTEYGTLYSLKELTALKEACGKHGLSLYLDGARLAYALACKESDVTLKDLARLCDVFYIGGTKCGALLGEAVVIPSPGRIPHFFTIIKQRGALLAKGRVAGVQFGALFSNALYTEIGRHALEAADRLRKALIEKGYDLAVSSPTNQLFVVTDDEKLEYLSKYVDFTFWEKTPDGRSVIRFATSWATKGSDTDSLISLL